MRWLFLVVLGCSSAQPPRPEPARAFYYWRTVFALSAAERAALTELHVTRLYVRMFDVGPDGKFLGALSVVSSKEASSVVPELPAGLEVVPVVFLRNAVFAQPRADLARMVYAEVQLRAQLLGVTPRELQLDCDWTDTTRDAYFAFLKELRARARVPLSATIRLHQVKYRERTGVPPVERGMLMFYNMGKFSADPNLRAIFDEASARRYLGRVDEYPLPLDAALPIWSWVVHLRDDQVVGLMESTSPEDVENASKVRRAGPDRFEVTDDLWLHGVLLRTGDLLKIEVTTPADTLTAGGMLAPRLAPIPRTVTLFDLSERNLARHGTGQLDQEFRALR